MTQYRCECGHVDISHVRCTGPCLMRDCLCEQFSPSIMNSLDEIDEILKGDQPDELGNLLA